MHKPVWRTRPAAQLKPLERPVALGDRVYHTLRQLLREGELGAGERLREVPLAAHLGVSRTPIREALAAGDGDGAARAMRDQLEAARAALLASEGAPAKRARRAAARR